MKVAALTGLVGLILGYVICRQWATPPAGPSQDSLRAVALGHLLGAARARAESVTAENSRLKDRLTIRGDSVRRTVRAHQEAAPPPPPDSAVTALGYWQTRAKAAEVLLDLTIIADSVIQDSLTRGWQKQIEETARLSVLVAQVQDSLADLSIVIGKKDQALARASRPCRIGTVNGGWSPLSGKAELTIGASCELLRLARSIF